MLDEKAMEILKKEAERKRELVRNTLFPFLVEFAGDVRYAKIFLYTASTAVDNVFNKRKEELKISDIMEEMMKLFEGDGTEEQKKKVEEYRKLFEMFSDETLNAFQTMVRDLPDSMERVAFTEFEKRPIYEVDINQILG